MLQTPHEVELKEACEKFESALLTPVLSGELVSWVNNVQEASQGLHERLIPYLNDELHTDYEEIAKSDMELAARVQRMVEDEKQLLIMQNEFRLELHQLAERAPRVHSDEAKVADDRLRVERQGLSLLTEIKRLQANATTWLQEAVYRDRGALD